MPAQLIALFALVAALSLPAPASAQVGPDARGYAIVVGSNAGGRGQDTLRYAERDAARMAGVLTELGGYAADRVHLVLAPTPARLERAIDDVATRVREDADAGRESVVFFYYSGHARAHALNLGDSEVPLAALRERLMGLPATLTIVVLDACQSGAFSRVKGAEPAADFSYNSVARLDAAGMAVMASSSATELSQESEQLGSSYFTHHLVVALRGAGDVNNDGRVSLDEAYRYAYHRTLASTAATAVGAQHVTLEIDLKGKGEVALTFPAKADAHIELPAALVGSVLLQERRGGAVVAEVEKAAGTSYRLAVPAGRYWAIVRETARGTAREGNRAVRCDLAVSRGQVLAIDTTACPRVRADAGLAKGGASALSERWAVELGVGLARPLDDAFNGRLEDFGFDDQFRIHTHYGVAVSYALTRHFAIVADVSSLDAREYHRSSGAGGQTFRWDATATGIYVRAVYPLGPRDRFKPYVQAGGGVARAITSLTEGEMAADTDTFWGPHFGVAAGASIMPWRSLGFYTQMSYERAPVIENLIGDTHDSGGAFLSFGMRGALR